MAQVYSKQFQALDGPAAGGYHAVGPGAGFAWILRDVQAIYQGGLGYPAYLGGFYLSTDSGVVIWTSPTLPQVGQRHQWEGRVVLEEGTGFVTTTLDDGWHVIVSGYQLSLP